MYYALIIINSFLVYQTNHAHSYTYIHFCLEYIYSTSSFDELLTPFNWHHQHFVAFVITLLSYHRISSILQLFLNQWSKDAVPSFFIIGIKWRGHFCVYLSRIVNEVHIPNADRCRSNLTDIQEVSMNTWNTYNGFCSVNCWILFYVEHWGLKVDETLHNQLHQIP